MTSLALYFGPGASSTAVHIALREIAVPFEARPVSLGRKETRTPAFLALNSAGKMPTLVVDGTPLTEVAGCPAGVVVIGPRASARSNDPDLARLRLRPTRRAASHAHPRHPERSDLTERSDTCRVAGGPLRNRVCCGAPSRPLGASPPAPFYPSLVKASASCTRSCFVAVVGFVSESKGFVGGNR